MAEADFYKSGEWNFVCDLCGRKQKSARAMFTWQGLYVCKHHKEVRNPQDFLRGVKDNQTVPWSRPLLQPVEFSEFCTLQGRNAIPAFAIPGCAIPSFVNLSFLPSVVPSVAWTLMDTSGNTIDDTNGNPIYPFGTPLPQVI